MIRIWISRWISFKSFHNHLKYRPVIETLIQIWFQFLGMINVSNNKIGV